MTRRPDLTPEQRDRVSGLIQRAHVAINHPVTAGPRWAKYDSKRVRLALDALWESHLILTGGHVKDTEGNEAS
jgi:hypothetical protein